MLTDRHFRRTSHLDWSELVSCPGCGAKWKAAVSVSASGRGTAHYGFGQEDARDRAGVSAFSNASDKAIAMIARAKCPRCGKRAGGLVSLALQSVLLSGVLGWLAYRFLPEKFGLPVTVAVVVGLTPFLFWWGLSQADDRVVFHPIEELPEHLTRRDARGMLEVPDAPVAPPPRRELRDDPGLDFDRSWQAPPTVAQEPADPAAAPEGELELDLDRKWNKK